MYKDTYEELCKIYYKCIDHGIFRFSLISEIFVIVDHLLAAHLRNSILTFYIFFTDILVHILHYEEKTCHNEPHDTKSLKSSVTIL